MRIAVISDVHSNLPALRAVLADIERVGSDEIWCLGDLVGYGADPGPCVDLVRDAADICLVGNHDLAVIGSIPVSEFSELALAAAEWTRSAIGEPTVAFLRGLRPEGVRAEVGLYHASPRDPVWEYLLSTSQADGCFDLQETRIGLVGHSHVALSFHRRAGARATGQPRGEGERIELTEGQWLLNPGSVGQPRDSDPRAAWLELDLTGGSAVFHRVEYDVRAAADAIDAAGLPQQLGERLFLGH